MHRRPPRPPLFPYTTLFRSSAEIADHRSGTVLLARLSGLRHISGARRRGGRDQKALRSEEHTSELQSLTNLVCRLLLEKKKTGVPVGEGEDPEAQDMCSPLTPCSMLLNLIFPHDHLSSISAIILFNASATT